MEGNLHAFLVPEMRKMAINLDEFSGLYAPEVIADDKAFVAKMTKRFEEGDGPEAREHRMRGELFEAIVNSQIAESDLMGSRADVIVPSRYDDFKNGVDGIVEFELEEGGNAHLALAIDVTESEKKMLEKFGRIRESIEKGVLSEVKYFKSPHFRGELTAVPRVVVGAGRDVVRDISSLLLRFRRLRTTVAASRKEASPSAADQHAAKDLPEVRNAIASHPLQGVVLTEIKTQLESFKRYAAEIGRRNLADRYSQVLVLIDAVLAEKDDMARVSDETAQDLIYQMIMEKSGRFGEKLPGGVQ